MPADPRRAALVPAPVARTFRRPASGASGTSRAARRPAALLLVLGLILVGGCTASPGTAGSVIDGRPVATAVPPESGSTGTPSTPAPVPTPSSTPSPTPTSDPSSDAPDDPSDPSTENDPPPPAPTGVPVSGVPLLADCPSATTTVGTAAELESALAAAVPGTVIRLRPGTYLGSFRLADSGTPAAPIWICGPRDAVLTAGSYTTGHAITLDGVTDVVLTGFSIDNAFKGITVLSSSRVVMTDMIITRIGYEAVHLRAQTVDSVVAFNTVSSTGLVEEKYGEGIYLGTSNANWCRYNDCEIDRSDRNLVLGNTIFDTGAQPIEAKEGTSGGTIEGNIVSGSARIEPNSKALILVKGNNYTITGNQVSTPPRYGLQTIASDGGWGADNSFAANFVTGAAEDAIWIHRQGDDARGNIVYCSNGTDGAELTNVSCVD